MPGAESGASSACCHCRWNVPGSVRKAACCWSAASTASLAESPSGHAGASGPERAPAPAAALSLSLSLLLWAPLLPGPGGPWGARTASSRQDCAKTAAACVRARGQESAWSIVLRPRLICSKKPVSRDSCAASLPWARSVPSCRSTSPKARRLRACATKGARSGKSASSSAGQTLTDAGPPLAWRSQRQNGRSANGTGSPKPQVPSAAAMPSTRRLSAAGCPRSAPPSRTQVGHAARALAAAPGACSASS
mmetsp:Transcript_88800/g.259565  ORF Transcript_88800/g.259565 Transcript_88800/m.259565 type:complete len:250 (-) Transcript_88800:717-1466(-)